MVRLTACQADGGGRLPRGHHPQTHDGKTGIHQSALSRPWPPTSRRSRSAPVRGCPSTGLRRRTISTTPSRSCVSGAERKELMAENTRLKRKSYPGRLLGGLAEKLGSPKVHVGPELAEGAPGGPVTGAFPGFSLGVLVMGQGPVEARGKRAVFSKARWARLCVRGAGSFHRACPFVTSGPRGALLHLPRVQLVKSRCPYDLRCTCVIFQPERWGPNSQTLAPLRVRAHRGDHAL